MTHTDLVSVLAMAIRDKLVANQQTIGLKDVLFGQQLMIPLSPSAVVTPGPKRKDLVGVSAPGGRTQNTLTVFIEVHSMKIGNEATERLALDQLSETIEDKLNEETTMGGIIIHGYITDWNPGVSTMENGQFRTVRMTYTGQTRTYLSS